MITLLIAQKSQNEEVVPKPPHKPWQVCSTHTSPLTSTLSSSWYSLPVRGRNTGTLHLTPGIIMKTWDLPRVWRYWLARGALDTVTGFRRVHCCSPRNRSLTFIAVEKNIVWFPKDWKKKKRGGGIKERNSVFFFFFWFYCLAFSPAVTEHQGCCSMNKRQQLMPARETGVSWASPFCPLPSIYPHLQAGCGARSPLPAPHSCSVSGQRTGGGQCGALHASIMGTTRMWL